MKPSTTSIRILAGLLAVTLALPAVAQPRRPAPEPLTGPWVLETEAGTVRVSVLIDGLESPWSLAFLPDGNMLLAERPGRLRIIRDGALDPTPISGLPEMFTQSISGLFDVVLHPDFEDNRLIYFAYPKPHPDDGEPTAADTRLSLAIARARWDGGGSLADVEDIFVARDWYSSTMSGENNRCCGQGPSTGSFGGRIAFDDENRIYFTSGDRNWGEKAQDPQSHLGKIIRLHDDGSIPDDNPYVGMEGYLPELYTIGHRNQLGLRFDPETGDLWESEFGPAGGDEVNLIKPGQNYGWFLISEGSHYNDEPNALGSGDIEGYVDPVAWWQRGGNPGNVIVYRGDLFPAWNGNLLLPTMSGARLQPGLVRLVVDGEGRLQHEERMLTEIGTRMRDVAEAPDGRIYILTESSPMASPGVVLVVEPAG